MKIIIAGSRNISTDEFMKSLEYFPEEWFDEAKEIVSGGARGVDSYGEVFAKHHNIAITQFIPDWSNYGKRAGIIRNKEMGDYADALFAVWDGESKGTKQMYNYALEKGLQVRVVYMKSGEVHLL